MRSLTEKLPIKQDARFLAGIFTQDFDFTIDPQRQYYMYVVTGTATVNGVEVIEGDGLSFIQESKITITNPNESEIILFDLQ